MSFYLDYDLRSLYSGEKVRQGVHVNLAQLSVKFRENTLKTDISGLIVS